MKVYNDHGQSIGVSFFYSHVHVPVQQSSPTRRPKSSTIPNQHVKPQERNTIRSIGVTLNRRSYCRRSKEESWMVRNTIDLF